MCVCVGKWVVVCVVRVHMCVYFRADGAVVMLSDSLLSQGSAANLATLGTPDQVEPFTTPHLRYPFFSTWEPHQPTHTQSVNLPPYPLCNLFIIHCQEESLIRTPNTLQDYSQCANQIAHPYHYTTQNQQINAKQVHVMVMSGMMTLQLCPLYEYPQ